jgi:hypothetical protein
VEVDIEKLRRERQRMQAELLAKTKEKKTRPKEEDGSKSPSGLKSSLANAKTNASESTVKKDDDGVEDGRWRECV